MKKNKININGLVTSKNWDKHEKQNLYFKKPDWEKYKD